MTSHTHIVIFSRLNEYLLRVNILYFPWFKKVNLLCSNLLFIIFKFYVLVQEKLLTCGSIWYDLFRNIGIVLKDHVLLIVDHEVNIR